MRLLSNELLGHQSKSTSCRRREEILPKAPRGQWFPQAMSDDRESRGSDSASLDYYMVGRYNNIVPTTQVEAEALLVQQGSLLE